MTLTLEGLAKEIGAALVGDGSIEISSTNTLEDADTGQVSFLSNPKYLKLLDTTRASAVIVGLDGKHPRLPVLKAQNPYYAFMQAVVKLHGHRQHPHAGIHPKAHVESTATVGPGTVLYAGAYVGARARVGRDCILYPNAVVYDDCVLGDRVILHSGAAIGPDGFGYATHKGIHHKIPQVGNVILEDDVEVCANTSIARAAMGSTVIGKGTKVDCLVMVAHGVRIGEHSLLVAQCGIAGSTVTGHHFTIGGQGAIVGHVKIGDNVTLAAHTGVSNDVDDQSVLLGTPAMPISQGRKVMVLYSQLPELLDRIRTLEQQVHELSCDEKKD